MVGIIFPLGVIGLTELQNSGWAKAYPAHLVAASLVKEVQICLVQNAVAQKFYII